MTMKEKTGQPYQINSSGTSLEAMIRIIDRQVDQVPNAYAAAGLTGFLAEKTEAYKRLGQQYIRFFLGDTAFGVPLQNAKEIDYLPEVTPLPNLPQWVLGICSLRGDLVSVVDIGQVIGIETRHVDTVKKLILVQDEDVQTALLVDKIQGMMFVDEEHQQDDIRMAPGLAEFVRIAVASDQQTVHLLDVQKVMGAIAL